MKETALREAITALQDELETLLTEVREKKQTINALCRSLKENPLYEMEDEEKSVNRRPKRSQFFGRPFSTVAQEFLQMMGEPCTAEEITNGLREGAFDFPWESEQHRMVAITLVKNSATFMKLPNNTFGLVSWYPDRKVSKRVAKVSNGDVQEKEAGTGGKSQQEQINELIEENPA